MIDKQECGCAHDGTYWVRMCPECRAECDRLSEEFRRGLKLSPPTTRFNDRPVKPTIQEVSVPKSSVKANPIGLEGLFA